MNFTSSTLNALAFPSDLNSTKNSALSVPGRNRGSLNSRSWITSSEASTDFLDLASLPVKIFQIVLSRSHLGLKLAHIAPSCDRHAVYGHATHLDGECGLVCGFDQMTGVARHDTVLRQLP